MYVSAGTNRMGSTWTWRMWPTELLLPASPVLVFGPYIGFLAIVTIWIYARWKFYSLICALSPLFCTGTQLKRCLLSWTPSTKTGFRNMEQLHFCMFSPLPSLRYMMFNLCSEKTYDTSFFHGRVERVLIDDHNVPSLQQMLEFANKVPDNGSKNIINQIG